MNEDFIDDLRKKAKENTWQVLISLNENMKNYIFLNENFNMENAIEINSFIMYLINIAPSKDYFDQIKKIIDKYTDIIIPEITKCSKDERLKLFLSLSIEIRTTLISKLKGKIPLEDLKTMWNRHFDDLLMKVDLKSLEEDKSLSYDEHINYELKKEIDEAKKSINDFGEEIISGYEKEYLKMKKNVDIDNEYIEKNQVPEYIMNEIKEMKMKRKQIKINNESIKEISKDMKGKQVFKRKELKEILEVMDKKQVDVALSQKPVKKEQKEQVIYNKSSEAIPKDKGVTVEGMGLPVEEKVLDDPKQKEVVVENKEKEQIVDIKPNTKEKPVQSPQDGSKVHYDQSEIIKKIKDQQKGKSSIDSKVE